VRQRGALRDIGVAGESMTIETRAGTLSARTIGTDILLHMSAPHGCKTNRTIMAGGREWTYHFINTGVPHVVILDAPLDTLDIRALGAELRYHADFAPAGTNVNFVQEEAPGTIRVRTYERGVEDETLACGTGMVASALIAGRLGWMKPPVCVIPLGGDLLEVNFSATPDGDQEVTLLGPVEHVFQGVLDYTR